MTTKAEQKKAEAAQAAADEQAKNPELTEAEAKKAAEETAASEEKAAEIKAKEVPLEDDDRVVMHPNSAGPLQDGNVLDHPAPRRADPFAAHRKEEPEKKGKK